MPSTGPTPNDLKSLAALRLEEAEALFEADYYDGAYYLCGYAIELGLKARICRVLKCAEYPPPGVNKVSFTIHRHDELLILSGLRQKLDANAALKANWSISTKWKPEQRYDPPGSISKQQAEDVLNAVRTKKDGVL